MADQLAAGWLPAYGHPVVDAPNVTALSAAGTTFESAYCASPLCAPSRASMLTGLLPSRTGVYDNAAELPASVPTPAPPPARGADEDRYRPRRGQPRRRPRRLEIPAGRRVLWEAATVRAQPPATCPSPVTRRRQREAHLS